MRMLFGHLTMWNMKMAEVHDDDVEKVDKPLPFRDLNHKKDGDFVYF